MQSLKELQKSFIESHGKRLFFIPHPELGIPYPVDIGPDSIPCTFPNDGEEYWDWIACIEKAGAEHALTLAAEIDEVRHPPEHKCYHLWLSVTWYERLYALVTKAYGQTLQERDAAMDIKLHSAKREQESLKEEYDLLLTQYRVLRNENRDLLMDLGAKAKLISALRDELSSIEKGWKDLASHLRAKM